jgi:flagellar motor switch/type III secretory pathway protein FliN
VQSDSKQPTVVPFEFAAADQNQSKSTQASLLAIATVFAKDLRKVMPFLARQHARTALDEAHRLSDGVLPPLDPGPSFLVKLSSVEGAWVALHFDSVAVLALVEGCFGAPRAEAEEDPAPEEDEPEAAAPSLGDALTLAQRALLRRLCGDIARAVQAPVAALCQIELAALEFTTLKRDQPAEFSADALAIDCRIENVRRPWCIRIVLGAAGLEKLAARDAPGGTAEPSFASAVLRVPVNVVAELGRVTLKLSQVLGLRVGDTLRLPSPTNDPVLVRVEGVPKFDAVPVISRGQVAVKIHARHEE